MSGAVEKVRKAKVVAEAYEDMARAAEHLGVVHGEVRGVIQNGECVSLFPTHSFPKDKVDLVHP